MTLPCLFSSAAKLNAFSQVAFDLFSVRVWKLPSNPGAGDVAGEGMQVERDLQPLLTGHGPVPFDLLFQRGFGGHLRSHSLAEGVFYPNDGRTQTCRPPAVWQFLGNACMCLQTIGCYVAEL